MLFAAGKTMAYKWVAGKVKKLLRSNFLSWSHHREVAKPDEARLGVAAEQCARLGRRQMFPASLHYYYYEV
jgi:hypothetical protein